MDTTMQERFDEYEKEHSAFEKIPVDARYHDRPDMCAFILLDKLQPGKRDMIAGAEHDKIWLNVDMEHIELSDDDVLMLVRCGVMYDEETDSLAMFV